MSRFSNLLAVAAVAVSLAPFAAQARPEACPSQQPVQHLVSATQPQDQAQSRTAQNAPVRASAPAPDAADPTDNAAEVFVGG